MQERARQAKACRRGSVAAWSRFSAGARPTAFPREMRKARTTTSSESFTPTPTPRERGGVSLHTRLKIDSRPGTGGMGGGGVFDVRACRGEGGAGGVRGPTGGTVDSSWSAVV
jgi:hypothetical protein